MTTITQAVNWDYFDRYSLVIDKYMPMQGEGESKASQVATAVNKLIYKWYNDGDVYDNVNSALSGWVNDLSSYANWLYKYYSERCGDILMGIADCYIEMDYTHLLKDLADAMLSDLDWLNSQSKMPKEGTIYECEGPFEFSDSVDEEDEEEWW